MGRANIYSYNNNLYIFGCVWVIQLWSYKDILTYQEAMLYVEPQQDSPEEVELQ